VAVTFSFLNEKIIVPVCGQVYNFENIRDAVAAQDEGKVNGKIVVSV
jgi:NADPH:quinone reductase-like Zn-dependent oxidoreductase